MRTGLRAIALATLPACLLMLPGASAPARACDVCAVYTSVNLGPSRRGPRLGIAEQFTSFGTRLLNSVEVENPGEKMESSVTQVLAGYNFGPKFGLQLTLPVLYRPYTRLEGGTLVSGSESGIGDLSLLGTFVPMTAVGERGLFRLMLFGGLKFPTGNSDPLGEEAGGSDVDAHVPETSGVLSAAGPGSVSHAGEESAIHGHDLALGSGSYDGVVGAQLFLSWDRFFWTTVAQYAIRTEGSFDYRYANDLTFVTGPGYFAYLEHGWMVGLQAMISGETKGQDEVRGQPLDDTALTNLFAGPGLRVSYGASLTAEVGGDIPFVRHETSLQIAPDYRIRAGLVWRF